MSNEYYAVVRTGEHLEHYGVKGMRWGVRKALITGNQKALDRHFRKAAKKLKKLEQMGLNSKKYSARSAAYGAAAIGMGRHGLIGVGRGLKAIGAVSQNASGKLGNYVKTVGKGVSEAGDALGKLGAKTAFVHRKTSNVYSSSPIKVLGIQTPFKRKTKIGEITRSTPVTVDLLARAGGAAVLGAAAARNAYKATHGAKYRQKAHEFRKAMNETFSGTPYAYRYDAPRKRKRKRNK